ncbi:MAG: FRG domain-containing protein [Chitinophagales bacterium]
MKKLPTYSNFKKKAENFILYKIDTIEDFLKIESVLKSGKGIYRGINSASYKIYTSLQREVLLNKLQSTFNTEQYVSNARNHPLLSKYFQTFNIVHSKLSVYSYLQHYGAPTPILDFTTKFEKALYFATEKFDKSTFVSDGTINDYFSIFFIPESDLELLSIPKVIEGLSQYKKVAMIYCQDTMTILMKVLYKVLIEYF